MSSLLFRRPFSRVTNLHIRLFSVSSASLLKSVPTTKLWIDGQEIESKATKFFDVYNPSNNELIGRTPETTTNEMIYAIESSKRGFFKWSETSITQRQRVMFQFQHLIRENEQELVDAICLENGKNL